MPKLPRLTPKKLIKLLKQNGFELDHTTGSHFIFYHPATKKRASVPYHTKDLPIGLLSAIFKDAGIANEEV